MNLFSVVERNISAKVVALGTLMALLASAFPVAFFVAEAATVPSTPSSHSIGPNTTVVTTLDTTGFENVTVSFSYDAEQLDTGDELRFGWRPVGGAETQLGFVAGINEVDPVDEIGSFTNVGLGAGAADLGPIEIYFTNTSSHDETLHIYIDDISTGATVTDTDAQYDVADIPNLSDVAKSVELPRTARLYTLKAPTAPKKVDICHMTGKGFNLLNVSVNALDGHDGHDGQVDIIPVVPGEHAGLNLSTMYSGLTGAQVLAAGCKVPTEPEPSVATVTMCKLDQNDNPLPGWQLALVGDEVATIAKNPTAAVQSFTAVPAGEYVLKAEGTYKYRGGTNLLADTRFSERQAGDADFGTYPYQPWAEAGSLTGSTPGGLSIQVNGDLGALWGSVFSPTHVYYGALSQAATADVDLYIYDNQYSDNVGTIDVTLSHGYTGVTGADGCVVFEDVPYGDYEVEELLQTDWTNVSGLGSVTVDAETETFTVVNSDGTVPAPEMCYLPFTVSFAAESDDMTYSTTAGADGLVIATTTNGYTVGLYDDGRDGVYRVKGTITFPAGVVTADFMFTEAAGDNGLEQTHATYPDVANMVDNTIEFDLFVNGADDVFTINGKNMVAEENCDLVAEEPVTTATVTMCKVDQNDNPLSGWQLALLGDKVEDVVVLPNGTLYNSRVLPAGDYVLVGTGTYEYRGSTGLLSDSLFSDRLPGEAIAATVWEDTWALLATEHLGIRIDGTLAPWGTVFSPLHQYFAAYTANGVDPIDFMVTDTDYSDNKNSSLSVAVHNGYTGITGKDGCVVFTDVPMGEYEVAELLQTGWENLSGLGMVMVDDTAETFTVVNDNGETLPDMCYAPIVDVVFDKASDVQSYSATGTAPGTMTIYPVAGGYAINLYNLTDNSYQTAHGTIIFPAAVDLTGYTLVAGSGDDLEGADVVSASGNEIRFEYQTTNGSDTIILMAPGLYNEENCDIEVDPEPTHVTVAGTVFVDANNNGVEDAGEVPRAGEQVCVTVTTPASESAWCDTTDAAGEYEIMIPMAGTYQADQTTLVAPWTITTPTGGSCDLGATVLGDSFTCDFGNYQPTGGGEEETEEEEDEDERRGSRSTGTRTGGRLNDAGPTPLVLGASTSLCPFLLDYQQKNWDNDTWEVTKLQLFLNLFKDIYGGVENPVNGVFGDITEANVMAFQAKYAEEVLNPWYQQGIVPHNNPTGFVYKTTLWKINSIVCPDDAVLPTYDGESLQTNVVVH